MWRVISRPLTNGSKMQRRWTDGRPTSAVAAQIAKPNDRLTSFERLEIYNRMYWFRVLDSLFDDCPGLRAVLGDKKFIVLAEAYLVKYPSASFTLRNLRAGWRSSSRHSRATRGPTPRCATTSPASSGRASWCSTPPRSRSSPSTTCSTCRRRNRGS